jgi:hypothetical protein
MKRSLFALLVVAVLAVTAVPAFAVDGTDNPGTTVREGAPYSGDDNPGLTRAEGRALGREECQQFKTNFDENRSAFGKCIAAVAKSLQDDNVSARKSCAATGLSRKRLEGQRRSNFSACVLAATRAAKAAREATE